MKCLLILLFSVAAVGTNRVCPPKNLTEDQKLDLVAIYGNHDNNSLVTASDMAYSILHNFDKNFDGEATPDEFEARWTCTYGDSVFFARFVFNQNAHGQPSITPSMLAGPPYDKGLPVEDFKNYIQQYYRTFQSRGCVDTDLRLDQQLDLIIANNDYNNDSRVTGADIRHDIANNYDADGDGYVTFAEGVTGWTCNYGFPVGYGIYFAQNVIGTEGHNISSEGYDPPFDTVGISVDELRTRNLKRYLKYYHLELAKGECAPSTITREEMLVLNAAANDFNNDLRVTSTDITYDVSENYDVNKDGRVTEDEWVARWTCAYADTAFEARYVFNRISSGEDSVSTVDFGRPFETGISVENFMSGNRKTYQAFVNEGCLNSDLPLDRKMDLIVSRVDSDKNGIVSSSDLKNFFSTTYDIDKDGSVNRTEFVLRHGCAFGTSVRLSRYLWSKINSRGNEPIQISQVGQLLNETDVPVAEFRTLISKPHYEFAEQLVRNGACLPPATPVEERLVVNAVVDDVDGNGAVTASDVSSDLSANYDTNGDRLVTEEEWLTRRGCTFGETIYLSRYMFNYISNGEVQIGTSVELYNRPPFNGAGFALDDVNNLHRWLTSNFTAKCVNMDLTLRRKLDILVADVDNDMNNTLVTTADLIIEYGRYDTNNDGNVSKAEFVSRWTCLHGDTVRFANFVWNDVNPSGDNIQIVPSANRPPYNETGEPVADFKEAGRDRYLRYARQQLSSGTCAPKTLDTEDKLILNAFALDFGRSTQITKSDIANDLITNYDKNHDDKVSEEEWVSTWTCTYGDSPFYASFIFATLTDLEFLDIALVPNNVVPVDDFVSENRERYQRFRRNRCVTTQLSLEQKLDRIVSDTDYNKDGVVTTEDLNYDINNHFDTNGDGNVTVGEWRQRWTCAYGDTASFALFVWNQLVQDGVTSVPSSHFGADKLFVNGMPVASFRTRNRQRYEAYDQRGGIVGR